VFCLPPWQRALVRVRTRNGSNHVVGLFDLLPFGPVQDILQPLFLPVQCCRIPVGYKHIIHDSASVNPGVAATDTAKSVPVLNYNWITPRRQVFDVRRRLRSVGLAWCLLFEIVVGVRGFLQQRVVGVVRGVVFLTFSKKVNTLRLGSVVVAFVRWVLPGVYLVVAWCLLGEFNFF
jgi:hypothetical protein